MAKPFGLKDDKEKKKDEQSKSYEKKREVKHSHHNLDGTLNNATGFCQKDVKDGLSFDTPRKRQIPTNVYYISNSKILNCGPAIINPVDSDNTKSVSAPILKMENNEASRRIRVRKGIFDSQRIITTEDIKIVSEELEENWKQLSKKLPGVTLNNSSYHQTFINAMDRNEFSNLTEVTLTAWKCVLPEFSTVGNLSKALFSIGHPDIVTRLRP